MRESKSRRKYFKSSSDQKQDITNKTRKFANQLKTNSCELKTINMPFNDNYASYLSTNCKTTANKSLTLNKSLTINNSLTINRSLTTSKTYYKQH